MVHILQKVLQVGLTFVIPNTGMSCIVRIFLGSARGGMYGLGKLLLNLVFAISTSYQNFLKETSRCGIASSVSKRRGFVAYNAGME